MRYKVMSFPIVIAEKRHCAFATLCMHPFTLQWCELVNAYELQTRRQRIAFYAMYSIPKIQMKKKILKFVL